MTELPNPLETPGGKPICPTHNVSAHTAYNKRGCRCEVCFTNRQAEMTAYRRAKGIEPRPPKKVPAPKTPKVKPPKPPKPELEHGATRYRSKRYNCRCEVCKAANSAYARQRYLRRKGASEEAAQAAYDRPKRPPGIVWTDATDITAVVRCERCDKNYGPWVFDLEGAHAFAQDHRNTHLEDPPFDWSAYDAQRLFKGAGGRPAPEGLCTEEGCLRGPTRQGLCQMHYMRAYREAAS